MRTFIFILSLVLLITLGIVFKNKGILFSNPALENSIKTKINPSLLIDFVTRNSSDYTAGVCKQNHFHMFLKKSVSGSDSVNSFYFLGSNDRAIHSDNIPDCETYFMEKLEAYAGKPVLLYTLRNFENYNQYSAYLQKNKEEIREGLNAYSTLTSDTIIPFKDCIFQLEGYKIHSNGYTIRILPISMFLREQDSLSGKLKEEVTQTQIQQSVETPTAIADEKFTAHIIVNESHAYTKPWADPFYQICKLFKGKKIKIISSENDFYYCDFYDPNGVPRTGYIKRADVKAK